MLQYSMSAIDSQNTVIWNCPFCCWNCPVCCCYFLQSYQEYCGAFFVAWVAGRAVPALVHLPLLVHLLALPQVAACCVSAQNKKQSYLFERSVFKRRWCWTQLDGSASQGLLKCDCPKYFGDYIKTDNYLCWPCWTSAYAYSQNAS